MSAATKGAKPTSRVVRRGQPGPAQPGTGDVWAYMGADAPLLKKVVHVGPVKGDPAAVLPKGAVAWCREGDQRWTEVSS